MTLRTALVVLLVTQPMRAHAEFSVAHSSQTEKTIEALEAIERGRSGARSASQLNALFDGSSRFLASAEGVRAQAAPSGLRDGLAPAKTTPRPAARSSERTVKGAIRATPRRTKDAFRDPARRRNLASRVGEGLIGGAAAVLGYLWLGPAGILLGVAAEFVYYEYIAEPMGWSGPYWERGPKDGETFKHG